MNDLITRLAKAIFRQEGMGPEHRNPGNLRDCPWFPHPPQGGKITAAAGPGKLMGFERIYPNDNEPVAYAQGFWVPRSRAEGVAGAAHVIALHIAQGDSLTKLISIWAPPTENNTKAYIQHVKEWAGIPDENLALWNYIQEPVVS